MLICYDKNEMIRAFGRATFVHMQAELGQEMVHEMNQMTLFTRHRIRTLAVWGRARYLSVTELPPNILFYEWMEKKHFAMTIEILW